MPALLLSLFFLLGALHKCLSQSNADGDGGDGYSRIGVTFDPANHELDFFTFVTRPEFQVPRLTVTTYDKSSLAPGYIFIGSYSTFEGKGGPHPWLAPFIYDSEGELIWSGSEVFGGNSAENFRVSILDGKPVLTALHPLYNRGVILDNTYTIVQTVLVNSTGHLNMHEFKLVDDGARALHLTRDVRQTSRRNSRSAGYEGRCNVLFGGIREVDLATDETTFEWDPEDHILLEESMGYKDNATKMCTELPYWDFLHSNSVDKLPDGDYLLSGRYGYAMYKISATDGSIKWRLGGKHSDFKVDGHFSGQHDVRCLFQNSTYMVVSMMDNAFGGGYPKTTNDYSRGLVLGVDLENMDAKTLAHYDHPQKAYASRAGSLQFLPNGNAFAGWRTSALSSEYTPDGRLIMEASFPSGLHAYRTFRFPWVGKPALPPVVHSQFTADGNTLVHVSWNGDTETAQWKLYKTDAQGSMSEQVASTKRTKFETAITYEGSAAYVQLEAWDRSGNRLVVSPITRTIRAGGNAGDSTVPAKPDITKWTTSNLDFPDPLASGAPSEMLDASEDWADNLQGWQSDDQSRPHRYNALLLPLFMLASSLFTGLAIWAVVRIRNSGILTRRRAHTPLPTDEKWSEEDTLLEEEEASHTGFRRLTSWYPSRLSSVGKDTLPNWVQRIQESFDRKPRATNDESASGGSSG